MWLLETRKDIQFFSPSGKVFEAFWKGGERSTEKKLGIFEIPKFDGSIIQDLGVQSTSYPITAIFQGINHNNIAEDFYKTLVTDRGTWEIIHPVKGRIFLQLVSCTELMTPVENANCTEISMAWLEPAVIETLVSKDQLFSKLKNAISTAVSSLILLQQARSDAFSSIQSAISIYNKTVGLCDAILQQPAETSETINEIYNSARAAFTSAVNNFVPSDPDFSDIAVSESEIILSISELPGFQVIFMAYDKLLTEVSGINIETQDTARSKEFSLLNIFFGFANSILSAEFETRVSVISAIENLTAGFQQILNALDDIQENFSDGTIDKQFFCQTENYQQVYNIFADCIRYLLSLFFSLQSERRFTLKIDRSPIEITVSEYRSLGDNDENYNIFIKSNQLSGDEILLIPAGREVVIYV